MIRYRLILILAVVGAILSATCFGAGIATIPLILNAMLGSETGKTLPQLAHELDGKIFGLIPDNFINLLPVDRLTGVFIVLLAVCVLTVIGATGKFMHAFMAMSAAMRTVANIRKAAFYRIIHLPLQSIITHGSSDRVSRIIRDCNQLRNGFEALIVRAASESLKAIAAVTVAIILEPGLCAIAILAAPILAFIVRKFSKRVQKIGKRALKESASLLGTIMQAVQGIRVVKVHTAERHEAGRFNRVNKKLLKEELSLRQVKALASPVVEMLAMFGIAIFGMIASWYIIRYNVEAETILATLFALGAAGASVKPLTQLSTDIYESAAAADRLRELLDEPIEISRGESKPRLAAHSQSITFTDINYTYPRATQKALDNINLTINHSETVAFVGPNGSGKTTLLSLIPRLFDPDQGTIKIDGIDISTVSRRSLRKQIGVVTQETVIFNDTIYNNISYGSESCHFTEIQNAAKQAFADEFINQKPDLYETVVGEQGTTLSGGERQKIAIARAILRNPNILILDEATSMIDADSEAQIAEALVKFCINRTALVIAHRLSTVVNADRIVVMHQGKIQDIGTHSELLVRCTLYQQLCRTQLGNNIETT